MNAFVCATSLNVATSVRSHRHGLDSPFRVQSPHTSLPTSHRSLIVSQALPPVARPIVPSPTLHKLLNVEDRAQSRGSIVKSIYHYIKERDLQDPSDRRRFRCDDNLKAVLGVDECTIIHIPKYIQRHLMKPEEVGDHYVEQAMQFERDFLIRKSKLELQAGPECKSRASIVPKPRVLSSELAAICGASELTRPEVIKKIWSYIRHHNLSQGHQLIKCDVLMKKVFHADVIPVTSIMRDISRHLSKKN